MVRINTFLPGSRGLASARVGAAFALQSGAVHLVTPARAEITPMRAPCMRLRPHALDGALLFFDRATSIGGYDTRVDIVPRSPLALFSQINARYEAAPRVEVQISPARPLADAVARIQADLDQAPD